MIKFHKVSYEQFYNDYVKINEDKQFYNGYVKINGDVTSDDSIVRKIYDGIKLPKRATAKSAGYDFFAPYTVFLLEGDSITIPTGISVEMDDDVTLLLFPRSGLGFKHRIQLDNTVGVIDADYYMNPNNEGHIMCKLTRDSRTGDYYNSTIIKQGSGYMQGIFVNYLKTDDDDSEAVRTGGFGSTTKKGVDKKDNK